MAAAQNISIQFQSGAFKITGWQVPSAPPAKGWAAVFVVYAGSGDVPPLLGSYTVESGSLVFHPTYPIAAGVHYRAIFHAPSGGAPVEKSFDGPPLPTNRIARVEHVFPSGDVWPSNQLRLYIYFSEPMSRAEAARHIHVLDSEGKDLAGSRGIFLPGEELWDPAFRRLTMTFDPGRIKRGLTSNESIGPPLTEGKRYTLVIDAGWPDARGVPMAGEFRKAFRGGPAQRVPPDPKRWNITVPKAGGRAPLLIDFPTPMNYPLLQRMIRRVGAGGWHDFWRGCHRAAGKRMAFCAREALGRRQLPDRCRHRPRRSGRQPHRRTVRSRYLQQSYRAHRDHNGIAAIQRALKGIICRPQAADR